mmetsp:Transcript_25552/g.54275  ORF Transcript_25552/g.54275 Transcript_25552/m.54275 type:complete len:231 (+) Transcript_25552:1615-2307(+)
MMSFVDRLSKRVAVSGCSTRGCAHRSSRAVWLSGSPHSLSVRGSGKSGASPAGMLSAISQMCASFSFTSLPSRSWSTTVSTHLPSAVCCTSSPDLPIASTESTGETSPSSTPFASCSPSSFRRPSSCCVTSASTHLAASGAVSARRRICLSLWHSEKSPPVPVEWTSRSSSTGITLFDDSPAPFTDAVSCLSLAPPSSMLVERISIALGGGVFTMFHRGEFFGGAEGRSV